MKIYKDVNLTEEIMELDLGVGKVGETYTYTYYVYNDINADLKNLNFDVDHPEVKVIEFPKELARNEKGKLVLEWKPTLDLKEALRTKLIIKGEEWY